MRTRPSKVLKNRLNKEGSESVTRCNRLKLQAADGKTYLTDVASPETLLRIVHLNQPETRYPGTVGAYAIGQPSPPSAWLIPGDM